MSVSATGTVVRVPERPWPLPEGLEAFERTLEATGDASAGSVTLSFDIRPQGVTGRLFVQIQEVWALSQAAMVATLVGGTSNQWQMRNLNGSYLLVPPVTTAAGLSGQFCGGRLVSPDNPLYLGENIAGTGRVAVTFATNTDTQGYRGFLRGLFSERPFHPTTYFR